MTYYERACDVEIGLLKSCLAPKSSCLVACSEFARRRVHVFALSPAGVVGLMVNTVQAIMTFIKTYPHIQNNKVVLNVVSVSFYSGVRDSICICLTEFI